MLVNHVLCTVVNICPVYKMVDIIYRAIEKKLQLWINCIGHLMYFNRWQIHVCFNSLQQELFYALYNVCLMKLLAFVSKLMYCHVVSNQFIYLIFVHGSTVLDIETLLVVVVVQNVRIDTYTEQYVAKNCMFIIFSSVLLFSRCQTK